MKCKACITYIGSPHVARCQQDRAKGELLCYHHLKYFTKNDEGNYLANPEPDSIERKVFRWDGDGNSFVADRTSGLYDTELIDSIYYDSPTGRRTRNFAGWTNYSYPM